MAGKDTITHNAETLHHTGRVFADEHNIHRQSRWTAYWEDWTKYRTAHREELDAQMDPLTYDLHQHEQKKKERRQRRAVKGWLIAAWTALQAMITGILGGVESSDVRGSLHGFLTSLGWLDMGLMLPVGIGLYAVYRFVTSHLNH